MDVPPVDVERCPDIYLVDHLLDGIEGGMATYLLDAERPALLDAGPANTIDRLLDAMAVVGIDPEEVAYILVSHLHLDHAGGTAALAEHCPNATVVVHERGHRYLTDPDSLARLVESVEAAVGEEKPFGDPDPADPDRCRTVAGGEHLDLGDRTLTLYDAPGHAPHHYTALEPDSGTLFAADAVGAYYEGRVMPTTPPPSFDLEDCLETVRRMQDREPARILFSHFGPGGDAAEDLERAETILPEWVEVVREAHEATGGDLEAMIDRLSPEWATPTLPRDIVGVLDYLGYSVSRS
jgi:glyoxylase-like metal-dependent hydrolase (beta-lactamase superfamily II)